MTFVGQVIGWFLNGSHWQGDGGIPHRLAEHVAISGLSLLAAAAIALPIGIILGHFGKFGNLAINISNVQVISSRGVEMLQPPPERIVLLH